MRALALVLILSGCATTPGADQLPPSCENPLYAPAERREPLQRPFPQMPRIAHQRLQAGWVCVGFDITEHGHIENARIVASYPQRLYESAALAAVSRWLFTPGEPVEDVRAVFRFKFQ